MTELSIVRREISAATFGTVAGLAQRARYLRNAGIFTEHFVDGMTWFMDRLYYEQRLDQRYGRFQFPDQSPLVYAVGELGRPARQRDRTGARPIINISNQVVQSYYAALEYLCKPGEQPDKYGEVVKLDVSNVLLMNERAVELGRLIADAKLEKEPKLRDCAPEELRERLRDEERERQVIAEAVRYGTALGLHTDHVWRFFKELIAMTLDVQVKYIEHAKSI